MRKSGTAWGISVVVEPSPAGDGEHWAWSQSCWISRAASVPSGAAVSWQSWCTSLVGAWEELCWSLFGWEERVGPMASFSIRSNDAWAHGLGVPGFEGCVRQPRHLSFRTAVICRAVITLVSCWCNNTWSGPAAGHRIGFVCFVCFLSQHCLG